MKFTLPESSYWIGDACYIYPSLEWPDFCACFEYNGFEKKKGNTRSLVKNNDRNGLKFFYKDKEFIVWQTAYGDGSYPLKQKGKIIGELGVDSGLLSIIPVPLASSWWFDSVNDYGRNKKDLGAIIELKRDRNCEIKCGNLYIDGEYELETGEEDENGYDD